MFDSYVLLAPFLLLPIVALLRFIGCTLILGDRPSPASLVEIHPTAAELPAGLGPGDMQQFTATVNGMPSTDLLWSADVGLLTSDTGLFLAPVNYSAATVTITASYTSDGTTSTGTVTIPLHPLTVTLDTAPPLKPTESWQFTATVTGSTNPSVYWSANAPGGKYTAGPFSLAKLSETVTASSQASPSVKADATVKLIGNGASFVKRDTATQGAWKGVYGKDGYALADPATGAAVATNLTAMNTPYVPNLNAALTSAEGPTPASSPILKQPYSPVASMRDLVNPNGGVIAAVWYDNEPGFHSFQIHLDLGDYDPHQFAVYCASWDGQPRAQILRLLDGDNPAAVLDSQSLTGFDMGVYLVWTVSGHIILEVANDKAANPASVNAVISGLFFG